MLLRRLATALALSTALTVGSLAGAAPVGARGFPKTVPLPDSSAPEGISGGPGTSFFAGSRTGGSIVRGDLRTGERIELVAGEPGGVAVGMSYDPGSGLLWVAGGPTGRVSAYDGRTGELVHRATVAPGGSRVFLNDVVVTKDAVYVTDSAAARLVVVPLGAAGAPAGPADSLTVTGDFRQPSGFGLNGIRELPGGELVVVSSAGGLFTIDPATGVSTTLLGADAVPSGDGLVVQGRRLYVVNAAPDAIGVVKLTANGARRTGTLTDDDLERPTTATFAAGALWVVNGKFTTPGATTFEIVRVRVR